jgi:hypothetical protein
MSGASGQKCGKMPSNGQGSKTEERHEEQVGCGGGVARGDVCAGGMEQTGGLAAGAAAMFRTTAADGGIGSDLQLLLQDLRAQKPIYNLPMTESEAIKLWAV